MWCAEKCVTPNPNEKGLKCCPNERFFLFAEHQDEADIYWPDLQRGSCSKLIVYLILENSLLLLGFTNTFNPVRLVIYLALASNSPFFFNKILNSSEM